MELFRGLISAAGRALIVGIFLVSAVLNKIPNYAGVSKAMEQEGVPQPSLLLGLAIAVLLLGSLSVLLGFKARIGAALLLLFLLAATYYFHDFWNAPSEIKSMELTQFLKNAALMGTMLFIIANGSGPWSLDELLARRKLALD